MWRKQLPTLLKWSQESHPKPLVLRGARQTGKSTLVHIFCQTAGFDLLEINFENSNLKSLEDSEFNLKKTIREIEIIAGKKINDKTILFFDEIQIQPKAFEKLRYFYESKEKYRVICAGSLLEVILENAEIKIPVGRLEYLFIGPMTFHEYLVAKKENLLIEELDSIQSSQSNRIQEVAHHRLVDLVKEFLFVGGMPEAVRTYIETEDFEKVRRVHLSIINTYKDDIPKYARRQKQASYVMAVFNFTCMNVGKSKIKFSEIADTNSQVIKSAIDLLAKANIIYPCFHTQASGLPLSLQKKENVMKLFFLDIGLLNAVQSVSAKDIMEFNGETLLNKGAMAEQFVAQHFAYLQEFSPPELFYWMNDAKVGKAEIDFVFSKEGKIFPCEVKAGSAGKLKSLWQFVLIKKSKTVIKMDLNYSNYFEKIETKVSSSNNEIKKISTQLKHIPLYCIDRIAVFLEK